MLTNPDLADTFEALVKAEQDVLKSGGDRDNAPFRRHLDYFYTGPVAQEVDRFFREVGGWLQQ